MYIFTIEFLLCVGNDKPIKIRKKKNARKKVQYSKMALVRNLTFRFENKQQQFAFLYSFSTRGTNINRIDDKLSYLLNIL